MQIIWNLIAKVVARPAVARYLIARAKRRPYYHIVGQDGSVYMERYWLFNPYPDEAEKKAAREAGAKEPKNWFPISIRLHRIMRPDSDRNLHDHPWNARTFILRGCYTEVRQRRHCGMSNWSDTYPVKRNAGDTAALKFGEYHRITHVAPDGVWTLFMTGRYRGTWGFDVNGVKMPWREYLAAGDRAQGE